MSILDTIDTPPKCDVCGERSFWLVDNVRPVCRDHLPLGGDEFGAVFFGDPGPRIARRDAAIRKLEAEVAALSTGYVNTVFAPHVCGLPAYCYCGQRLTKGTP